MTLLEDFLKDKAAVNQSQLFTALQSMDLTGEDASFSEEMLQMAHMALEDAQSTILKQQERIRKLETLSTTDELTGLYNRRGFYEQLDFALKRAKRNGEHGVLVLGDLDSFKLLNDTFGHACGDLVLEDIARTIQKNIRGTDMAGRLGGDEFAILLTGANLRDARQKVQQIHNAILNTLIHWGDDVLSVEMSFGVCAYRRGIGLDTLYQDADADLYANKAAKRRITKRQLKLVTA